MARFEVRLQIPNHAGEVRVLALPRSLVLGCVALLPLCLALVPATVWLTSRHHHLANQVESVSEAYAGARYLFEELSEELNQSRELNNRLRIVADNSPPSINGQFFGIGGLQPLERDATAPLPERLRGLADEIRRTKTDLATEQASFSELTRLLEERQMEMLVTPSIWPTHGWVASHFGQRIDPYTSRWKRHAGLDIAGRFGTPVVASAAGQIDKVAFDSSYGNYIVVNHGRQVATLYAHLEKAIVAIGDDVRRGDVIGYLGSTGRSTGPHLHYEVRERGVTRNPMEYIRE